MSPLVYTSESLQLLLIELGVELSKPLRRLLAWLMLALLEKTRAHLFRLADKLPDDDTTDRARRQKVRRFLSNPRLVVSKFLPALLRLLRPLLTGMSQITLSMDRTSWEKRGRVVTILSVGLVCDGLCFPLFWLVLDRAGNTGMTHWQTVLTPVLDALRSTQWLPSVPIAVTADREFASPKLAEWLWLEYRVESTLRAKRSEYLEQHETSQKIADWLEPLQPGECRFLRQCTVTKTCEFQMNVALLWEKSHEEPWVVITTQNRFPDVITTYRLRWPIEPMHRNWKSSAFDIEGTRVTDPQRIERLLIPIALCYALCGLEGARKERSHETTCAHKDKRTSSVFLEGLTSYCRILRSLDIWRVHRFFERLFDGARWLERMQSKLQTQTVTY